MKVKDCYVILLEAERVIFLKRIVLTGGGTAGHVTPNIALLPKLKENGWDIVYIGSHEGIEKKLIKECNIPYYSISSGKLRRYASLENLKDPFKVVKGLWDAFKILKKLQPDVIFSKGGYVTVPVVIAANLLKIPVVIHESDMTPGLANKIAMRFAKTVCVNFEETLQYVGKKGVFTGTPIRAELFEGNKESALKLCHFEKDKPVLLVMGGSLGSVKLNMVIRSALDELLAQFNIIHICGKGNVDEKLAKTKGYCQFEYVTTELPDLFAAADIMLSRAGANAVSEIIALNIPSLLIPLSQKASRGDQILNASAMHKKGYCKMMEEEQLTKETLIKELTYIYHNRDSYKRRLSKVTKTSGIDKVLHILNRYGTK